MKYSDAVKEIAKGKIAWRPSWPSEYFIKMLRSRRIHDSEERFFPQPKHRVDVKATDWVSGDSKVTPIAHRPVVELPPPPPPPVPTKAPVVVVPPTPVVVRETLEEKKEALKKEIKEKE